MMLVSVPGLAAIRQYEGLRLSAYRDSAGVWTIGYGSTRYADGTPVKQGDTLPDAAAADVLFRETLRQYEDAVSRAVLVPLSQPQFDALVSLTYNIGIDAFRKSTLLRRLNAHDYRGASSEFLRWNKAGGQVLHGLQRRREAERAMFLSGTDARPNDAFSGFDLPNLHTAPPSKSEQVVSDLQGLSKVDNSAKLGIKPMAPVLAALLPTLVSLIPELGKLFGSGSAVADRNLAAAEKVAEVVVAATGAPNLQGAVEVMQADPVQRQAAREALAPMLELTEAGGGGIEGAREFNAAMHATPFWLMPAFWISLFLLPLLYYTVHVVLTGNGSFSGELKAAIASSVVTGVLGGIIGFWLGSSFTTSRSRGLDARPTA